MDLNQYKTGVAQPGISVKNLNAIDIAVPPLKTQKQIVKTIEKLEIAINKSIFGNLVASISIILPKR